MDTRIDSDLEKAMQYKKDLSDEVSAAEREQAYQQQQQKQYLNRHQRRKLEAKERRNNGKVTI